MNMKSKYDIALEDSVEFESLEIVDFPEKRESANDAVFEDIYLEEEELNFD